MPDDLQIDLRTLSQLLSGPAPYLVPAYQRPYSWTAREALQLLEDLLAWIRQTGDAGRDVAPRSYFLGTILLVRDPDVEGGVADIVDGQQRLVTLSILIALLRDSLAEADPGLAARLDAMLALPALGSAHQVRRHRLGLRGSDGDRLTRLALLPGSTGAALEDDGEGPAVQCMLAVRAGLQAGIDELDDGELHAFARHIGNVCRLAVIESTNVDDAHRIFTVINERGKPLEGRDILKAEILGNIPAGQRERCLRVWESLDQQLGGRLDELFSHIHAAEGAPGPRIVAGIRAIVARVGGAERFVDGVLDPYGTAFLSIARCEHHGSPHSPRIRQLLRYLNALRGSEWLPATLAFWRAHAANGAALAAFLAEVDRLNYALRLLSLGSERRAGRFRGLIDAARAGKPIDAKSPAFSLSREELRNIAYNLRALHPRSPQICKHLLMRLSDDIAGQEEQLDPAELTIEHVLPLKPGQSTAWRAAIPDAELRARCTELLGNLVLVPRDLNLSAGNLSLDRKLAIYFGTGSSWPAITDQLRGRREWTARAIIERDADLLARIRRIWRLELPASEEPVGRTADRPRRRGAAVDRHS